MKEKIAKWYKQGLWTAEMVKDAVGKKFKDGVFTEENYAEIVKEDQHDG